MNLGKLLLKSMVSVRIFSVMKVIFVQICRSPNQIQGQKTVSLVIAGGHFDLPTDGCVTHMAKQAHLPSLKSISREKKIHIRLTKK